MRDTLRKWSVILRGGAASWIDNAFAFHSVAGALRSHGGLFLASGLNGTG